MKSATRRLLILFVLLLLGITTYSQVTTVAPTTIVNVSCFGGSDGSVTITVTGGTPPYTIQLLDWTNFLPIGSISSPTGVETFSGLQASEYFVRASDALFPTTWKSAFFDISQPALLKLNAVATDITCNGALDGKINATASDGTPPYTYTLKVGGVPISTLVNSASVEFSGLGAAANYTVEVVDANMCGPVVAGPYTIVNPTALSGSIDSQIDVLCFGESTGSVTIDATGGTTPYEYSLNGGAYQASATINGLPAGSHTITIRDAHLCTFDVPVTITQPASALTGSITSQTNVLCYGDNTGSVTVSKSGGTGPWLYSLNGGPFQASGTFNSLTAGAYTVTIQDDNLCTFDVPVNITQPAELIGTITSQTNVSCFGGNNGSVTVAGSGGVGPYQYSLDGAPYQASGTFSSLTQGSYTVTVRDANLCIKNVPVTITQPAAALSGSTSSQTNVSCFGGNNGSVTVAGSGGTSPYQYSLNGGAYQASGTFGTLTAGPYTVTVRDANLCTFNVPVTITQPTALGGSITSQTNVSCFGGNNGSVTVAGSGGTVPYQYSLNGGAYQASGTFGTLTAGSYTVTVRDANLCTFNVPVTITQPTALGGSITSQTNVSCFGGNNGSVTVAGSGGVAPYQYSLNGGAYQASGTFGTLTAGSYTVTVRDANLCTHNVPVTITEPAATVGGSITSQTNVSCFGGNNGSVTVAGSGGTSPYQYSLNGGAYQASGTFGTLTAGPYTVTVRDANLCTFNVPVTITQPTALGGSITSQTNVSCFGGNNGSVTVAGSGGTAPYQYSLNGGAYQASGTFGTLTAGSYTVTVRDANLCTFNVPVTITQPAALGGSITSQTNVSCFGGNNGSVTVAGSGGTSPYQYSLNGGAYQASGTFGTLTAGSYTVTVRDANLCTHNVPVTITEPAATVGGSITSQTNVSCFGGNNGSVTVAGSGGTAPYQYSLNGGAYQASGTFGTLTAGPYTVTVRDVNLCTFNVPVTITQPLAIGLASLTANPVTGCYGNTNGSIQIAANGGTPNYTYTLFLGATQIGVPQTPVFPLGANFTGLTAGTYSVSITDANSCPAYTESNIVLSEPPQLVINNVTSVDVVCNGESTGSITINASGGTPAITYSITGEFGAYVASNTFTGLASGDYEVWVKDANGCTATWGNVYIGEPEAISVSVSFKVINTCYGDNTGEITITPYPGTLSDYDYTLIQFPTPADWGSNNQFLGLAAGNYYPQVRQKSSGCIAKAVTSPIVITQPTQINFNLVVVSNVVGCSYNTNGILRVQDVSGGIGPWQTSLDQITWLSTPRNFTNLGVGNHTVYVRDSKGCVAQKTATLTGPAPIVINPPTVTNATCFGASDGTISVTASGGTGALEYSINGTVYQPTGNFTGLSANTYTIYVRDINGCVATQTAIVGQPAALYFTTQDADNITCFGLSDGQITLVAAGGSAPYTYSITGGAPFGSATGVFTGLSAGTYIAAVRDASGCSTIGNNLVITEPAVLAVNTETSSNISCFGANDGSISVTGIGGTNPLTYSLLDVGLNILATNGTGNFNGLSAGVYTVNIDDANGCGPITAGPYTISEPTQLTFTYTKVDLTCFGVPTGQIDVDATGGTPPYQYSFNGGITFGGSDVQTGLSGGNHTVIVRDANLCESSQVINLLEPSQLSISLASTNITCNGLTNGQIIATASGGTTTVPYQYRINGGAWQASGTFSGLSAATYLIEVQDANGCIDGDNATIIEPTIVTVDLVNSVIVDPTCSTLGNITAVGQGGTPPYTYTLNPGTPGQVVNTTGIFNDLAIGSYTIRIADANNCPAYDWAVVLTGPPALDYNVVSSPILCFGEKSTVTINVTSGTAPYEYSIDNEVSYSVSNVFADVPAGSYQVWVKDASGCRVNKSLLITEPSELNLGVPVVTQESAPGASDGRIAITATGGTGTLTYDLYLNGVLSQTTTVVPVEFSGLAAGTYYIVVTDANGCNKRTADIIISGISIVVTQTNVLCNGGADGEILVTISGGIPPFTVGCISVPAGQTYPVNNIAPGQFQFENLAAGDYLISITDGASTVFPNRQVTITQPDAIVATYVSHTNPSCNGLVDGTVEFNITGGTAPYTITWLGGSSIGNIATGVGAGTFVFTITDANGCAVTVNDVPEIVEPAGIQIIELTQFDPTCNGQAIGLINVTATGGFGTLTYTLSGSVNISNETGVFENLLAGVYDLSITDANGCVGNFNPPVRITLTEPTAIQITGLTPTEPLTCPNVPEGFVRIQVSGGQPDYSFLWSNGQTTVDLENVVVGDYTVYVTDAFNCQVSKTFTVAGPPKLELTTLITQAQCRIKPTGDDGRIEITGKVGGTGSFTDLTYQWNDRFSTTGPIVGNISGGTYTVTITDLNSCVYTFDYEVPINPRFDYHAFAGNDTTVCYDNPVVLHGKVSGGDADLNFIYEWFEIPNTAGEPIYRGADFSIQLTSPRSYLLRVTDDDLGCLDTTSIVLQVYPNIGLEVPQYISAVQDTIISVLMGKEFNMDVITQSVDFETTFEWKPGVMFIPSNSWNSSLIFNDEIKNQIPADRFVTLQDPVTKRRTEYILVDVIATTEKGCVDSIRLYTKIVDNLTFGNVFSPNGDGINDVWRVPKNYLFPDLEIEVFNRWGSLVWSAKGDDAAKGWNGRTNNGQELPIGTYYYIIKYNVNAQGSNWKPLTGSVTIVK